MNHDIIKRIIINPCFKLINNNYLFFGLLFLNLLLISITKFYPSLDGPAHLHNANILKHLISGNDFLETYYTVNSIVIPNWISHIFLATAGYIFPAWLAEKALLMGYISGMAFSFRYFVRQTNPKNIYFSLVIFPFAYTFLFHLGFYNFSLSFIFLFLAIGLYYKMLHGKSHKNLKNYLLLFTLFTLCYFSNALTFSFLGLILGILILQNFFFNPDEKGKKPVKALIQELLKLLLISLPGIILFLIFFSTTSFYPSTERQTTSMLFKWIIDLRALIVYAYNSDEVLTQSIFILLTVFLAINTSNKKQTRNIFQSLFLLIPLVLSIAFLFTIPDDASAGMMSTRFCIIFSFLFLGWISLHVVNVPVNGVIIVMILILHTGLLFKHLNGTIKKLDKQAQTINRSSEYIDENSIVLPVYLSDNWLTHHFSNYIATEKPIVVLENYEAGLRWFPVKWNKNNLPNIQIDTISSLKNINWVTNQNSPEEKQINYIVMIGDQNKISEQKWDDLRNLLSEKFDLNYKSPDNFVTIYEFKLSKR